MLAYRHQFHAGNFADVYEVRCPDGGRWAVKCFTRSVSHLRERYFEISRSLRQARLPFTVDFRYLEEGIPVAGRWHMRIEALVTDFEKVALEDDFDLRDR